jgi:hypothetical protein
MARTERACPLAKASPLWEPPHEGGSVVESSSHRLLPSAVGLLPGTAGRAEAAITIAWLCASCRRTGEKAAVRHLRRAPLPVEGDEEMVMVNEDCDGEQRGYGSCFYLQVR